MTHDVAFRLVNLLRDTVVQFRNNGVPLNLQVLVTLQFMAEGGFQKGFGEDMHHPIGQ